MLRLEVLVLLAPVILVYVLPLLSETELTPLLDRAESSETLTTIKFPVVVLEPNAVVVVGVAVPFPVVFCT